MQLVAKLLNDLIRNGTFTLVGGDIWNINFPASTPATSQPVPPRPPQVLLSEGPPLATFGAPGDLCIDWALGELWQKEMIDLRPPVWTHKLSLGGPGPQGPRGEKGAQGLPGQSGRDGTGAAAATGAKISLSAPMTIHNNSTTAVIFDTEDLDEGAFWDVGSPTKLTISQTGWYLVTMHVKWASNSTGKRVMDQRINGATFLASTGSSAAATGYSDPDISSALAWKFTAGDYVECTVYQDSGTDVNVTAAQMQIAALQR